MPKLNDGYMLKEAAVTVRLRLQIPEARIDRLVANGDSFEAALQAVEAWVEEELPSALEHMSSVEVEADA